jgi:hypothetical protein
LTEADISEFGRQLYEWSKRLPLVQRGMLHRVLSRAAAEHDADTAGFAMTDPESLDVSEITALLRTALLGESGDSSTQA